MHADPDVVVKVGTHGWQVLEHADAGGFQYFSGSDTAGLEEAWRFEDTGAKDDATNCTMAFGPGAVGGFQAYGPAAFEEDAPSRGAGLDAEMGEFPGGFEIGSSGLPAFSIALQDGEIAAVIRPDAREWIFPDHACFGASCQEGFREGRAEARGRETDGWIHGIAHLFVAGRAEDFAEVGGQG